MNIKFCGKTVFPIRSCKMHSHRTWEIILHLSGTSVTQIGNDKYTVSAGSIMVIPPETPHDGRSQDVYTDMYIQAESLDFDKTVILRDYDGNILNLMQLLHKTFTEKENEYIEISNAILETICLFIKKYTKKEYKYDFVHTLKNEIYKNLENSDFRINTAVAKLGYNIDYVRHCFFEEVGKTPHEYLSNLRLSTAKKLLIQESFISIGDVAEKCGYNDSFYFSKIFRKTFGISPREYRKKHFCS